MDIPVVLGILIVVLVASAMNNAIEDYWLPHSKPASDILTVGLGAAEVVAGTMYGGIAGTGVAGGGVMTVLGKVDDVVQNFPNQARPVAYLLVIAVIVYLWKTLFPSYNISHFSLLV